MKRLASSRNFAHITTMQSDRALRSSDRSNDIRTYGKMDSDLWKIDDLRGWFNSYAPSKDIKEEWSPSATGYTIRVD